MGSRKAAQPPACRTVDYKSSGSATTRHVQRVRTAHCAAHSLLDYYFIRKEERGGAVVKLHQIHAPVQIINLTQDAWLFAESTAPFVVAHRSLQLAMLSDRSFCVYAGHHTFYPSTAS